MREAIRNMIYNRLDSLGVMDPWIHSSSEFADYSAFLQIYLLYRLLDILS